MLYNLAMKEYSISHKEIARRTNCEIFLYPNRFKGKEDFISDECEFTPAGWMKSEGLYFPLGFKVVTEELQSLGLRQNPNIMTFTPGVWSILDDDQVTADGDDWGGIWTALKKGSIKTLEHYMMEKYRTKTRAFLTAMYRPVFANSYRIKSQGALLLEEIK